MMAAVSGMRAVPYLSSCLLQAVLQGLVHGCSCGGVLPGLVMRVRQLLIGRLDLLLQLSNLRQPRLRAPKCHLGLVLRKVMTRFAEGPKCSFCSCNLDASPQDSVTSISLLGAKEHAKYSMHAYILQASPAAGCVPCAH